MIQKIAFTPQVSFKANENILVAEENVQKNEEKDNSALLCGSLAVLGAFGLGMVARKPKVVEKVLEKSTQNAKTAVEENRLYYKTKNKKQRIKHTTPKPVTLEEQSRIINNIDASNTNSSSRKLLEEAINDTPTKAEIEAARPKYEAPTQEQKNDIANLHRKNKEQRKELNSIGSQTGVDPASQAVTKPIKKGVYAHQNGNQYIFDENGNVVKILDCNSQKGKVIEVTDEKKIAKHIAKHNIDLSQLTVVKKSAKNLKVA